MRCALATFIVASLLLSGTAYGQSAPPVPLAAEHGHSSDRSDYRQLIAKGIAEFNLGHWSEAKAFFLRAHAIRPNARTLRTLGLVSYELRDYVDALRYLEQSLASSERPLAGEMRSGTEVVLEEARSFVARVVVVLEPSDASLRLDGRPVALNADRTLLVNPGEYEFSAELSGFEPVSRSVRAYGGAPTEVRLRLTPIRQPERETTATAPPPFEVAPASRVATAETAEASWFDSLSSEQHVGLALGAVGVVGLGIGTTFSVLAVNENLASNEGCTSIRCTPEGREHRKNAQAQADVATVSFIAGGALLGAGATLVIFGGQSEREAALSPIVSPSLAGLSYSGVF